MNLFDGYPEIADDRMRLGHMKPDDAAALTRMTSNELMYRYLPTFLYELRYEDKGEVLARMDEECFATRESIHLGMYLADEPDELAGIIEFYNYDEGLAKVSIGYRIDQRHWGKGIGTHALGLAVGYLMGHAGIETITAHVMTEDGASGAVLEKNGFVRETPSIVEDWGLGYPVDVHRFILVKDRESSQA